jgi:histidyl-tRNA synthetase
MGGGGRYDGLVEQLGGKPTPAIGFGTGLERLIINLKRQGLEPPPVNKLNAYIAVADRAAQGRAMSVASSIRAAGLSVLTGTAGRSLKAQMRQANAFSVDYALIIGAQEMANGTVAFRDLATGVQETLAADEVVTRLTEPRSAPST